VDGSTEAIETKEPNLSNYAQTTLYRLSYYLVVNIKPGNRR